MTPTARIIVVTHNQMESATRPCIESVLRASGKVAFQLTVVDNKSTDGTRDYLIEKQRQESRLHVILNDKNLGFAAANNRGLSARKAPYYVLLNSDTVVDSGWLDSLVGFLEGHPEIGMAGPISNSVGNEQKIEIEAAGEAGIMEAGRQWARACRDDFFYTRMLGFFCVVLRREVLEQVGLLDENFGIGFFEDDDYCLRTLAAGFQLACHEGTFVLHKGGLSFNQLRDEEKNALYYRNLEYFQNKHGLKWNSAVDVAPFARLIEGYLKDIDAERFAVVRMKIANRLETLKRFEYAKKNLESIRLWQACIEKDQSIDKLQSEIQKQEAMIRDQQSRINALELEEFIKERLSDHAGRLSGLYRIFGTGKLAEITVRNLGPLSSGLVGYFDNNPSRWGFDKLGLPVSRPEYIAGIKVLICSQYVEEIYSQLIKLGFKTDDIIILRQNTQYNPYDFVQLLKPISIDVIETDFSPTILTQPITVVTTIKNESKGIDDFLASLSAQTRQPDQLVIVDGGSSDDTIDRVKRFAAATDLNVEFVEAGAVNVPQGRNIGIGRARHPIVVFLDAGCVLEKSTLANLVGPFESSNPPDLSAGIYDALAPSVWGSYFIPNWNDKNTYPAFLPSARLVAMSRSLLDKTGLFPEHLKSGEDTLFAIQCRRRSSKWVVNRRAKVYWDAPQDQEHADKLWRWYGKGDGESGVGDFRFYGPLMSKSRNKDESLGHAVKALFQGYLEGRANRAQLEITHRRIEGIAVILAGVPINDIGGGQRGTQLALEFIRRNYKVIFVNVYPSYEERVVPIFFDTDYTLLELYGIEQFDIDDLMKRYSAVMHRSLMILEFPHPQFLPLVEKLKAGKSPCCVLYDYLDNWDSSLGGAWHSPQIEQAIIDRSDALMASAVNLRSHLSSRTSKPVCLIPNAVNSAIFNPEVAHPVPSEYEPGRPVALYTGALYGEWFDWEIVEHALREMPDWLFVFIGNSGGVEAAAQIRCQYSNARFLGPQPQLSLPQYLQHADACIIPFKAASHITKFVNPLKVYEYLAMQKPVVATAMDELRGICGVALAETPSAFVDCLREARNLRVNQEACASFVKANDWGARIDALLAHIASINRF